MPGPYIEPGYIDPDYYEGDDVLVGTPRELDLVIRLDVGFIISGPQVYSATSVVAQSQMTFSAVYAPILEVLG